MSGLYQRFKTNESVEKDGVILQYGSNSSGEMIEIRIARAGGANTRYIKRLERELKPYRRQIQNETMDESVAKKIMRDVFAETVVLSWSGVEDQDGKPMEFSPENCKKLFDDLPELFNDIQQQSQNMALFRDEIRSNDAKN